MWRRGASVAGIAVTFGAIALSPVRAAPPATGSVTVAVTPGHPRASFRPDEAFGGALDGHGHGAIARLYRPGNVAAMRSAGLGPVAYRLRTELGDEAWHWNPEGSWSDPVDRQGYWTSSSRSTVPIDASYGYRLPRRGNTLDQADNRGYSRLDDGDPSTFWKSNPYLDGYFTGEPESAHPQWVVVDLGRTVGADRVHISWGVPYATRFSVQYWVGGDDGDLFWVDDPHQRWREFPGGHVERGVGGDGVVKLAAAPIDVRYVRLLLTGSSGRPPAGSTDRRDGLGYAVREIGIGVGDGAAFRDLVRHGRSTGTQSVVTVSSTDPWHRAADIDRDTEQPGFDRVLRSGLTNGLPAVVPVPVLFGTPEDARAELSFLAARRFPVGRVELGEEPDGRYVAPEDYGALFVQWARALHALDPGLVLGGPALQTGFVEVPAWPDAAGDTSWLHRFSGYLARRGASPELAFLSVEWFPFDDACPPFAPKLAQERGLLRDTFRRWAHDGFGSVPVVVTEFGYSAYETEAEVDLPGALLDADFVAQFLALGGAATYVDGYEPSTPAYNPDCRNWGDNMMLEADRAGDVRYRLPTYWETRLLTRTWSQPGNEPQRLYDTAVRTAGVTPTPVSAYALHRSDGRWAILVLNNDPRRSFDLDVRFSVAGVSELATGFAGPVDLHQYGPAEYHWSADGADGRPDRSLPPSVSRLPPGRPFTAPASSLSVLVGPGPPG